jgi:signal transduction histidine kinase
VLVMLDTESQLTASRRLAWLRQRQRVRFVALGGSVFLLLLTALAALVVRGDLRRREQAVRDKAALYQFQERLVSIVGHDLRNPLSAVLVSTQMLLKRKEDLREGQVQAVERIARSASRIDALGNLLMDFTQARLGGGVPLRREQSDARPAVERAIDELRSANHPRELVLETRTANTSGNWDVERIAQVVSNLVSNALRYGSKERPIQISLEDAQSDAMVIAVHNDGEPIAPALLPHLFEPYKRGAAAPAAYAAGLGLGLYIVREIAVAHGGEVTVHSTRAGGTTFRAKLPRT